MREAQRRPRAVLGWRHCTPTPLYLLGIILVSALLCIFGKRDWDIFPPNENLTRPFKRKQIQLSICMHGSVPLCPEQEAFGFSELIATSVYSCSSAAAARTVGEEEQDKSTSIIAKEETTAIWLSVSSSIDLVLYLKTT